ncbi:unnamed protein product [Vicia faba]|uniref:Protein FLX-like 4 n=1 Tax=Vicia faba TaxID=3906 RepID=A0AAV1AL91_VICFA|nr:unnamed protein product [Vicia faba]
MRHSHGSYPPQLLENKLAQQEAEIERISGENHRLSITHRALRDALVDAGLDVQKIKSHIRSTQTESDIQIRVLLDKMAKMELEIRGGDVVKKELQQAHMEAQSLAGSRQELRSQIQLATQELKMVVGDVERIPDLHAEFDGLMQEHIVIRDTFDYEKSKNVELVDQLKAKEKKLIAMAREVEMLRSEILNAEKRINASNMYGAATPADGSGPFLDHYGRTHGQMAFGQVGESMVPVGDSNGVAVVNSANGSGAGWAGQYDPSIAGR